MPTEATFLLAGLFIVAAVTGWAFARFSDFKRDAPAPTSISPDYLRGLNLVLNRQTDEALELFVRMAKVDDETLETHFALGHLFRRRGEVDRAIRVHQNLLARPSLSVAQRDQALFSLAQDYLGAGLFDRAEKLFRELGSSSTLGAAALRSRVDIYERQSDWSKAIEAHRELEMLTGEKSTEVAHYYCELAERARLDGDLDLARQHLKSSVRSAGGAFRGALIRAAIAQEEKDYPQALRLSEQILEADRRLMVEVLPELVSCYRETGREQEFESYLQTIIDKDSLVIKEIAYAAILGQLVEHRVMADCMENFILKDDVLASILDADRIAELPSQERQASILRIADGLRRLAISSPRYRCTTCGYNSQRLVWHCPSCKSWESIRPLQKFQFEGLIT